MLNETPKIILKKNFQIVIFICFLLDELGSLTENQIIETATFDDMVSVFNLSQAFGIIEEKKLADIENKGNEKKYTLNNEGKLIVREFLSRIPLSLREKALNEGKKTLRYYKLKRSLDWGVYKTENGFEFKVKLLNEMTGAILMEIKLFSLTEKNAQEMEKRFLNNPSDIIGKTFNAFVSDGGEKIIIKNPY